MPQGELEIRCPLGVFGMSKGMDQKRRNSQPKRYPSLSLMTKKAERGDLEAQHQVGAMLATGARGRPKDEAAAVRWYSRAAESGHAMSQYDLAFMLLLGEGTETDTQKGLWWMEQAVKNGHEYAASVLTDIYRDGLFGVEIDRDKAASWNEKSGQFRQEI
jgi:uncharacterized protein